MKYKFKAKDLKTGEWVEGDLIYAKEKYYSTPERIKPMIVTMCAHGGMLWATIKHVIDESTIELIKEE